MLLSASSLVKQFQGPDGGRIAALGPLDLEIHAGEFVCIVGPSGCGKSTLLRMVAGLDEPTAGRLEINGRPIEKQDASHEDRPFNSMVFQGDSTFPWLTVYDNVGYGLRVRNVPFKEREAIVRKMLRTVGLAGFADAFPYQLSGGMRQRVALARSLANDPHLLLMDEPFGALDAQNRDLLQDELLQIWDQTAHEATLSTDADMARVSDEVDGAQQQAKKTILFVTHSIEEAIVLGDRVIVLSAAPGQVKADIRVPFPRPRTTYELRRDPGFGELVYQIWETLRDEVNAARAAEQHTL